MLTFRVPTLSRVVRTAIAGAVALAAFHAPALVAQRPQLAMLDRLEAGQWEVRDREPSGGQSRICIDSGRRLIQIRHMRDSCRNFVVEDGASAVTVHYTCSGHGYGQTHIRFENPRLVQLETQGIAEGLPFQFAAEARRTGGCMH